MQHAGALATLTMFDAVLDAGIQAAGASPRVFDDLAALGLSDGRITGRLVGALLWQLLPPHRPLLPATPAKGAVEQRRPRNPTGCGSRNASPDYPSPERAGKRPTKGLTESGGP
jgi:hypothetical protein